MYNEEIKEAFLAFQNVTAGEKNTKSFFKIIEEIETKLGKDIAEFSKNELVECFENLDSFNPSSVNERLLIVKRYRAWYNDFIGHCETHYLPDGVFKEIDFKKALKKRLFFSPDDLLDKLEDRSDIYYETDICVYILAWCQIELSDAVKIKKTDLSFTSGGLQIQIGNKIIKTSNDRFIKHLRHYRDINQIERQFAVNTNTYYEDNEEYLIRNFKPEPSGKVEPMQPAAIRQRCKERSKLSNSPLIDYRDVTLSGMMYELFKAKQNGEDPKDALKRIKPTFTTTKIKLLLQMFEQYLEIKNPIS